MNRVYVCAVQLKSTAPSKVLQSLKLITIASMIRTLETSSVWGFLVFNSKFNELDNETWQVLAGKKNQSFFNTFEREHVFTAVNDWARNSSYLLTCSAKFAKNVDFFSTFRDSYSLLGHLARYLNKTDIFCQHYLYQ